MARSQPAGKTNKRRKKPPRTAAVILTCPPGEYSTVMGQARSNISLTELEISNIKVKRAITGALILEIPDLVGAKKADRLANKMANLFANAPGIKVARPTKRADLRVRDLHDSATVEDVSKAEGGGCLPTEVKMEDIQRSPAGLGTI
jgi:hypothetical protein